MSSSIYYHSKRHATYARMLQSPSTDENSVEARQIERLPALASTFYGDTLKPQWGTKLRELFIGIYDENSILNTLRGMEDSLLKHVYSFVESEWAPHVTLTIPASCVGHIGHMRHGHGNVTYPHGRNDRGDYSFEKNLSRASCYPERYIAFSACGTIDFPKPKDRNINMMPFIIGDKSSLPPDLHCYYDCIKKCPLSEKEYGQVGYLTVQESFVEAEEAQRRTGLHIETPGAFIDEKSALFSPGTEHHWGMGISLEDDTYEGGIYMASNMEGTTEVFDALVHKNINGIVDRHGGCEHLRGLIGPGTVLKANQLIWMTDCTPHEALPQQRSGYRQYFRLVTPDISHWFADHSTRNPLVPIPEHVIEVYGNKFVD